VFWHNACAEKLPAIDAGQINMGPTGYCGNKTTVAILAAEQVRDVGLHAKTAGTDRRSDPSPNGCSAAVAFFYQNRCGFSNNAGKGSTPTCVHQRDDLLVRVIEDDRNTVSNPYHEHDTEVFSHKSIISIQRVRMGERNGLVW